MRANALPRALLAVIGMGAAALMAASVSPAFAVDLQIASLTSAELTPEPAATLVTPPLPLRPSFSASPSALTNQLLQAYVDKQKSFRDQVQQFDVTAAPATLTPDMLLGYIEKTRADDNLALSAIDQIATPDALNTSMLETYAEHYVPTVRKVAVATSEKLCLSQAIYNEARGESVAGQWAVANVIINRANSHHFPTTLCGVVYQNADQGYHKCQFTFACDGKPEVNSEKGAWNRAVQLAAVAYKEFKAGDTPGVLPNDALYYHTTAVDPSWSDSFKRVAVIGAHEFYATY